ncbi:GTPase Era, mitochondrial [Gossypium arboreum]|uniref:GTPase Era, mitochondrial n=1 Tax=Gossypium arboreum TaxID=29729 RepID=A0A0B0P1L5_GOSAR|nr:GTPase Era, mitochondrial [Gossypium arboreum]
MSGIRIGYEMCQCKTMSRTWHRHGYVRASAGCDTVSPMGVLLGHVSPICKICKSVYMVVNTQAETRRCVSAMWRTQPLAMGVCLSHVP